MARRATLQTIADAVGVSRSTVSNAYNRPDQLNPALRERILAVARELGYPGPDPAARRLRTGQAGAVGLLFTEALAYAFTDPAAVAFLEGLAHRAEAAGTALLLVPSPPGADPSEAVRAAVRTTGTVEPDPAWSERYRELHAHFTDLYPALRDVRPTHPGSSS